jgi:hypothetical protein
VDVSIQLHTLGALPVPQIFKVSVKRVALLNENMQEAIVYLLGISYLGQLMLGSTNRVPMTSV